MEKPEVYVLREGDLVTKGINTYAPATVSIIDTSEGLFLVDVGSAADGTLKKENGRTYYEPYLGDWLSEAKFNVEEIVGIILTHNHPDHAALANPILSGVDPSIPVYGPDSIYRLYNAKHSYQQPLKEGEELVTGVKVIKLPGHESSLDQGVLVDTDEGLTAIVGDAFLRLSEYNAPEDFSLWPPNDKGLALESRKKIIGLESVKVIIPGHDSGFYI